MKNRQAIELVKVEQGERRNYLELLLLADDSQKAVEKYIYDGDMFSISCNGEVAGVVLFTFHPDQAVELKNIALDPKYRGRGLGKFVIHAALALYKERGFDRMIVGTANSSIGNLAFYQKAGFRMTEVKKDFFKDYPSPIIEDGIRALDMVMFERRL